MGRKSVKQSLKTLLEGVSGVNKVYEGEPRDIPQKYLPAIVLTLPTTTEIRKSVAAGAGGRKGVTTLVRIRIMNVDTENDSVASELVWDDLLDAIDVKLRSSVDLGDTVLGVAQSFIRTETSPPILIEGRNVARVATKEFEILTYEAG